MRCTLRNNVPRRECNVCVLFKIKNLKRFRFFNQIYVYRESEVCAVCSFQLYKSFLNEFWHIYDICMANREYILIRYWCVICTKHTPGRASCSHSTTHKRVDNKTLSLFYLSSMQHLWLLFYKLIRAERYTEAMTVSSTGTTYTMFAFSRKIRKESIFARSVALALRS